MWSVRRDGEGESEFAHETIDVNLRRIPWLLGASMLLALWPIASLGRNPSMEWLRLSLVVDLASAGLFLAVNFRVRRLPHGSRWRSAYVWTIVFLALVYMDIYYFLVDRSFGQNPFYILGTIMAATVFLLPPQRFVPLLVANHLAWCAILVSQTDLGLALSAVLIENTTGATVAGLVSLLLYRAHREEYLQRRALAAANRALSRRNKQLNDLMAITAHDLRAPLLGIRDLVVLARKVPAGARQGKILGRVAGGCASLIALVNRLLYAHAVEERAEKSLAPAVYDVREVVRTSVEHVRAYAEPRDIKVKLRLPASAVELRVDPAALGQVIDNLLFNAIKFSPSGDAVEVQLLHEDGAWRCYVADNGPGVPENERAMLFQKFHRGANRPVSGDQGSGLGLFIVATLMQAMGGKIEYAPSQPHGALFRITFGSYGEVGAEGEACERHGVHDQPAARSGCQTAGKDAP